MLAGCASTPPAGPGPLAAPRVATTVRHVAGSPLGAGAGTAAAGSASAALQVTAELFALEELPSGLLDSLASRTRLAFGPAEERPLLAAGKLIAGARAGTVTDPDSFEATLAKSGRVVRFAELRGALPEGVTAVFEAGRDAAPCAACEPVHERFAVHVHRPAAPGPPAPGAAIEIALDLEDTHAEGPLVRPSRELACLDPVAPGAFAVVVRSPFHGEEPRALAALVRVEPPDPWSAAHAEAFAVCAADLAREAFLRAQRGALPAPPAGQVDIAALRDPTRRRRALLGIARASGALLLEELALTGTDDLVAAAAEKTSAPGWDAERAAIQALREAGEEGGLLVRRAGAAGRNAATFFELAGRARSLEDLERLLVSENMDFLEDASPGSRVQAFEWLAARGRAPAGYDPLGPAPERRAALERIEAAEHLGER